MTAQQRDGSGGGGGEDSDLAFVAKGVAFSFVAGAAIKYGSLLVALPHEPNAAVALAVIVGTPAAYAAALALRSGGGGGSSGAEQ